MRIRSAVLTCLLLVTPALHAETRIGTWNLEHLSVRPNKDFAAIAKVAANVDFLAVQELMSEDALDTLAQALSKQTGHHWSAMSSSAVGRSSYKEMYGFVWRDDAVAYADGAVTYLDRDKAFARDPYSARFKSLSDHTDFVVATVHILYGKHKADRAGEITALSQYWAWLGDTYHGNSHLLLMGDFNTPPTSPAWDNLDQSARPLLTEGASTLSTTDGKFANLYDNIFIAKASTIKINTVQIFAYPKFLGLTHQQARASVSDHAPLFLHAQLGSPLAMGRPSARN
ncbi:endonuclease/exonuclease/phosphatase family protein [Pseudomonas sp. dw_358]|uniref:endonuclease/exonuclease/phosphatase family protein n=1 Tax=Pseudomonas sp. dw_358 TaxID=2720083 RepID=UPI001BD398EF|nr:endonuclease/exonuclease/phosphatase family protein [Pseudomonas sp. dw_358]